MTGSNGTGSTPQHDGEPIDSNVPSSPEMQDTAIWQSPSSPTEKPQQTEEPQQTERTDAERTVFGQPVSPSDTTDPFPALDDDYDDHTNVAPQAATEDAPLTAPLNHDTPAVLPPAEATEEAPLRRPRRKRPWYRKPLYLAIAAGLALALILAITIPIVLNLNNAKEGDRVAEEYTNALATHRETWTEERLTAIASITASSTLEEKRDFFTQSAASMTAFNEQCKAVETATKAMSELKAAPMPTLANQPGLDASSKYQDARQTAASLETLTTAEQTLVTKGDEELAVLTEFCLTLPQYNSVYNQYAAALEGALKPTLTMEEGDKVTLDGGKKWTCKSAEGCPDLTKSEKRTQYADAFDASTTTFYSTIADLASKQCFLSSMKSVCDAYSSEWSAAATSYKAATDALRNNEPKVEAGSPLFPDFESNVKAAADKVKSGDTKVAEAWKAIDTQATDQDKTGWQSRSLKRILGGHESALAGYVDAVRQSTPQQ